FKDWRAMPAPRRGEILFRAAQLIAERKEDLARLMSREMGKVLFEARGEVQEAIDEFFYMAGEGRRLFGFTTPSEMPNKFACCVRDPVGVVGLITPWNFPVAVPSWKLAPALIAGNTIVWKPAGDTPMVALALARRSEEAGRPPGQAGFAGDGGQERHHGHGRRGSRSGGAGDPLERLWHQRAALHRREPPHRPPQGHRRADRAAGGGRAAAAPGQPAGRNHP